MANDDILEDSSVTALRKQKAMSIWHRRCISHTVLHFKGKDAFMDAFFLTITWFGSLYLLIPLSMALALALCLHQRVAEGVLLLASLITTSLIAHLLKLVFARPRPQVDALLVTMPSDFSFPSAHTAQITAFACACWLVFGRDLTARGGLLLLIGLASLALLVGISRNYLKVHYISDVVAGALLGAAWVLFLHWLFNLLGNKGML